MPMSRYYFDWSIGTWITRDPVGREFPDPGSAERVAQKELATKCLAIWMPILIPRIRNTIAVQNTSSTPC